MCPSGSGELEYRIEFICKHIEIAFFVLVNSIVFRFVSVSGSGELEQNRISLHTHRNCVFRFGELYSFQLCTCVSGSGELEYTIESSFHHTHCDTHKLRFSLWGLNSSLEIRESDCREPDLEEGRLYKRISPHTHILCFSFWEL